MKYSSTIVLENKNFTYIRSKLTRLKRALKVI